MTLLRSDAHAASVIENFLPLTAARLMRRVNLFRLFLLMLLTLTLSAQETKVSKIPDGEAQFTAEQLEAYYRVYKNADVKYLRRIFDASVNKSGGTAAESRLLEDWRDQYLKSKFIVLSRDNNVFGGSFITILFQARPDKVFVAWIYPEGENKTLTLRKFEARDFSEEDLKRIRVRYRLLIEDKNHAM